MARTSDPQIVDVAQAFAPVRAGFLNTLVNRYARPDERLSEPERTKLLAILATSVLAVPKRVFDS
jgi:hypothetical protein